MNRGAVKWLVISVTVLAYIFAVINRSSFATLGTVAQQHFGAEATVVSLFIMVQILVYALAQIPVGIFLDAKGAATVITFGLVTMATGQFILGQSDTVVLAILARLLVGAGDACIFTCMVKVIAEWFAPRFIPTANQIAGLVGQGGQLIAVAPLAALVGARGWSGTFSVLALLTAVAAVLSFAFVKNSPREHSLLANLAGRRRPASETEDVMVAPVVEGAFPVTAALPVIGPSSSGVFPALKSLVKRPGIRMAFWTHWCTGFANVCFTLLWGTPFMTGGLGYSFSQAAGVVSTVVIAAMVGGVITGPIVSRFSTHRIHLVITMVLLNMGVWTVIVFWQGNTVPVPLMTLSAVLMGLGGPISMVAFDLVRTYAPVTQRGIATGLANMGGFTAALICVLSIGILLDLQGAGSPETYAYEPFKWAMFVMVPVGLLGALMILIEYPRTMRYVKRKRGENA